MSTRPLRTRFMERWWDVIEGKPLWLQNGVGRVVCWFAGHERGRAGYCDWCGKTMVTSRGRGSSRRS